MGAPVEKPGPGTAYDNPAGTDGMAFIEFSAADPAPIADLFRKLGFQEIGRHATRAIGFWRQGDIDLFLNSDPGTHGARFSAVHGPCISAIAFRVRDAAAAFDRACALGAVPYDDGVGPRAVDGRALVGIGGSLLYLVDAAAEHAIKHQAFRPLRGERLEAVRGAGFQAVDHLTHNVLGGHVERWADFYRRIFNFREVFYLDAKGTKTGFRTRAMKSPCNKICIPVNEPTDPQSQIQEYIDVYKGEGVQHIALLSGNLNASIEAIAGSGIAMQAIPDSYYAGVDARLPGHGQDLARLKRNGILVDGERDPSTGAWGLLLQIFSKNLLGPIFFEFIERRGNEGFGEGNAKALFEAIERDQIERGVVVAQ
ncbi:MAG TPA: 4-hydroxyphenylpyruvate dioxygenase [Vineibacter sp.]|nr:4-hydroxyphenylpyruvate dioxygenase [Vineibacter sp.]